MFADASAPTAAKAQWDKDERLAKSLLTQKLPDSTVVLIHGKKTVRERWEAVVREFSKKSVYAQADWSSLRLESMNTEQHESLPIGHGQETLVGYR